MALTIIGCRRGRPLLPKRLSQFRRPGVSRLEALKMSRDRTPCPTERTSRALWPRALRQPPGPNNWTPPHSAARLVTPDAFKPSSLWFPASVAVAVKTVPAPAVPPERIAEFRSHHRLTAVMKSSGGVLAIIGGKVYVPGQQIADGFSVRSIDEHGAVVVGNGLTLDLPIEQPGALTSLSPTQ